MNSLNEFIDTNILSRWHIFCVEVRGKELNATNFLHKYTFASHVHGVYPLHYLSFNFWKKYKT